MSDDENMKIEVVVTDSPRVCAVFERVTGGFQLSLHGELPVMAKELNKPIISELPTWRVDSARKQFERLLDKLEIFPASNIREKASYIFGDIMREFNIRRQAEQVNENNQPPTEEELKILKNPVLFTQITEGELGKNIVGEKDTIKAIFLFSCIRLVKNKGSGAANNLLVNAASSAGKDYITKKIVAFHPKNCTEEACRVSPTALTYYKDKDDSFSWDGKIFRLADITDSLLRSDVFKTFISDNEKSIITNKNGRGQTGAYEYNPRGKPILIATSASANPSEELLNRMNIATLDESEMQTKAITKRRLAEAAGRRKEDEPYTPEIVGAFGKLQPVNVRIPFIEALESYLPADVRSRRDVPRMINLIKASVAIHQFQREQDSEGYVLANKTDYEIARAALQKIQTGSFVSLTRALKRVFDAAKDWEGVNFGKSFSVKELHAYKPFCSEQNLYDLLDKLAGLNFLKITYETREGSTKPIMAFGVVENGLRSLTLPEPDELFNTENTLIALNDLNALNALKPLIATSEEQGAIKAIQAIKAKKGIKDTQELPVSAENEHENEAKP